ncbi:adenosine deaminase [Fodinibius salinus]|uniref:adenosine deaminase n=1 Tax=Fodinibius salinus TaxID=860790 RepID=A0A5D3YNN1_9BACT|nr:adenosine deaminase [Fodinibius salinus]TYP95540.1 adenosine deaminase [Fodinibius salinus]
MDFSSLPKIELHLHLDCSLSYDVVSKLNPDISKSAYRDSFVAPDKCRDLADYISRSQEAIKLMQTKEALTLVVEDLFKQLQADHVIYAELRFAPLEHTKGELSAVEVVETVSEAVVDQIGETGTEAGIILCTLRHYSEAQSMHTVKLVEQFSDTGVVGFDIAADEAGFPIDNHISAFEYADEHSLNCTAHAGEARGAASVQETLEYFKPARIGHGVRSAEDEDLLKILKKQDIHLEVCPTSNIQTNVYEGITDHTVDMLFESGVSLSINTDTRTISDVTLTEEYQKLQNVFQWDKDQLIECNLAAIEHAFTTEKIKKQLRQEIIEAYKC